MKAALTTCQICARAIMAKTGVIAHHGYERPDRGSGWQTGSCPGARHVPYEVGCGALDLWIINLRVWILKKEAFITELKDNPTERYDARRTDGYGRRVGAEPAWLERPVDFDAAAALAGGYIQYRTYAWFFVDQVRENERHLKGMRNSLSYAEARRTAWVAPT